MRKKRPIFHRSFCFLYVAFFGGSNYNEGKTVSGGIVMQNIILENKTFSLTLCEDGTVASLLHKPTGEECLELSEPIPFMELTEERPFDNNIKLAHPCKKTTFAAKSLTLEGDRIICGFSLINSRVAVEVKVEENYIGFRFAEILSGCSYGLAMDFPPVYSLRFLQLPIKSRKNFGEWLSVMWDEAVAVNVLATCPFTKIDSHEIRGGRMFTAEAMSGIKLIDCSAALVVSARNEFLDVIDKIECDYSLPRGAKNRRGEKINRSCYWSSHINPQNVDAHIECAKRAGLSMMLIYYPAIFRGGNCYGEHGGFNFLDTYPRGLADLRDMLDKIKAAGITVGFHVLHTHIGFETEYFKGRADHRLRLKEHFTLAAPLSPSDDTIFVEESPEFAPKNEKCKILNFSGELIRYSDVTTTLPYRFLGCSRGELGSKAKAHDTGEIGGVLDVSEYCATSAYIDQKTSLQDEIADKIAEVYSAGFEFMYFDGSEGTNPPYEIYIPYAQYRVYKKLKPEPLFCEGAAKAHFSWHMLSGGNAFDVFGTQVFKEMTDLHPAAEAVRMQKDFTRINFGWWALCEDTQPDIIEYGTSRAAGFDCPGTLMENQTVFKANKRIDDIFEVMRRWEDVRAKGILSEAQKEKLRVFGSEHTLIINEEGEYELCPCFPIRNDDEISAFLIERENGFAVSVWHKRDRGALRLATAAKNLCYMDEFSQKPLVLTEKDGAAVLPVEGKRYIKTSLSRGEIEKIIQTAQVISE